MDNPESNPAYPSLTRSVPILLSDPNRADEVLPERHRHFHRGAIPGVIVRLLFGLPHGSMSSRGQPSAVDRQTVPFEAMRCDEPLSKSLLKQAEATKTEYL